MGIVFADAVNLVRSELNASSADYATNDDPTRWPDAAIIDAVRGADGMIYDTIASTPGHPKRSMFLVASANIAHAGLIPSHIGPVGAVLIGGNPPEYLPSFEINSLRKLTLGTPYDRGPYFDLIDNRLYYYPGSAATVDIVPPFDDTGMSLQSPGEYYLGVVCLALAVLFGKEGVEVPAASHYLSISNAVMQMIKSGAQDVPPTIMYAKA